VKNGIRDYGRAPKGELAVKKVSKAQQSVNLSVLPALSLDGYIACNVYKGGVTADLFEQYIEEDILPICHPWPGPKSVIIMDNARIHCCNGEDADYELENWGLDAHERQEIQTVLLNYLSF
jgi:hypothetical protein